MRVALFTNHNDASVGGAFYFEQAILQAVVRQGLPFEVVNIHRGKDIRSILPTELIPVPKNPAAGQRDFQNALKRTGADHVWFLGSFEPSDWPYTFTVLDVAHRRFPDFPESSVYGWRYEEREHFFESALGRASAVIVGTETGKQEVVEFYRKPPASIHVIPYFAPPFPERSCPVDVGTTDYFFYPAQFWPHKNHIVLLDAMVEVIRSSPHVRLMLVGSDQGNLLFVTNEIARRGLQKNVQILGFVPRAELRWLYENARAVVFPTYFGPDNLPPLEAFSLGCPVVASEIAGARDQLGDAVMYCSVSNAKEWAAAMARLLQDETIGSSLVSKGRRQVEGRTEERYVAGMSATLTEVSQRRRCWGKQDGFTRM